MQEDSLMKLMDSYNEEIRKLAEVGDAFAPICRGLLLVTMALVELNGTARRGEKP